MKKKKIDYWLLATIGMILCVFGLIALLNDHIFMFLGDILDQQLKMYIQAWDRVRRGSLFFWDWTNFMGANYYGSNTFYFIGSPFFWLTMLLPSKEMILPFFLTLNAFKSVLCGIFTFMWIKKITDSGKAGFVSSICFTFCAYILCNYSNNHMLDVILFFPLCLYFVECYLKDSKWVGLVLTVGGIGIVNYYFLYVFTPFLWLYTLVRYLFTCEQFAWKKMFKKAGLFLGCYALGLCLCMVTLYPSFLALDGNPRSSELVVGLNTIGKHNLYRWVTAFFSPVCHWREDINYYISNHVAEGIGWGGGMLLYSMMLTPYLLIVSLFSKKDKATLAGYVLYAIYVVFSIFPFFYILFNQNYETRWMINIVLINIYFVGVFIGNSKKVKTSSYVLGAILTAFLLAVFYLITKHAGFAYYENTLDILLRNTGLSILLVAGYAVLFTLFKSSQKMGIVFLVVLLFCEVGYTFYNLMFNDGWYLGLMTSEQMESYDVYNTEVVDYIKEYDSGFYRIDVGSMQFIAVNDAKSMNFNSFNTYHSVYNYNQYEFLNRRFVQDNKWTFFPQRGKWQLKNLLGSKYWFTHAGEKVPFSTNSTLDYKDYAPYGYELIAVVDGTEIYENKYYLPFAYTQKQTLNKEVFLAQTPLNQDRLLNWYLITESSENNEFEFYDHLIQLKKWEDKELAEDLIGKEGGYLYITLHGNVQIGLRSGYRFYNENHEIIKEGVRQDETSYFGVQIPENAVTFELDLQENQYEVYYDDLTWYDDFYNEISSNVVENVKWDDNSISGTISLQESSWISTSVPYDSGWTLKVDGHKADITKVNCGFVGFELSEGAHRIELMYTPPGLVFGAIVTFGSLLCILIFKMLERKRNF